MRWFRQEANTRLREQRTQLPGTSAIIVLQRYRRTFINKGGQRTIESYRNPDPRPGCWHEPVMGTGALPPCHDPFKALSDPGVRE